jgi:GT2 family glycosyltransferase
VGALGRHRRNGPIADISLTVVICTHNPRPDFLQRTLASLRDQALPFTHWDLLIIDNASTNDVLPSVDLAWHPNARVIREDRVGLTMARLRAIAETSSELLLFVDDDNELAPDYANTLLRLAGQHPSLGCFGAGRLEPEFEEEPADELRPYTYMLALRTVGRAQWSNIPTDGVIPWGAGLAVRRPVAKAFAAATTTNAQRQQLGRTGESLHSGEDDEFSWIACDIGFGKGVFPELRITHLIAAKRVKREYLLAISEGHAYSEVILAELHDTQVEEAPIPTITDALGQLLKLRPLVAQRTARRAWAQFRRPALVKQFEAAERAGRLRARTRLRTRNGPEGERTT